MMKKLVLALIPVLFLAMAAGAGSSAASELGWDNLWIELEEGQTENVLLTVENGAHISLVPRYAFEGVENVIFFSPSTVDNGVTLVLIHFERMGVVERERITPDKYRVWLVATQTDNKEFSLLIYLDLTGLPENVENIQAQIDNLDYRIGILTSQVADLIRYVDELEDNLTLQIEALGGRIDNLFTRVASLENAPLENWLPEIESLRAWTNTKFDELRALIPENSSGNLSAEIDALEATFNGMLSKMKADYEQQIADAGDDAKTMAMGYAVGAAVLVLIVTLFVFSRKTKRGAPEKPLETPETPPSPEGEPPELKPLESY